MPTGQAIITHVLGTNDYSYAWKADISQQEPTSVLTGKTKVQAYNEVLALLNALTGQLKQVNMRAETATATGVAQILHVTTAIAPNDYGYTWKDDDTQLDVDNFVAGKTKALAASEIGTLINAMAGALIRVEITGVSV